MGEMGYGYGSECHLLRWMGRHRHAFDKRILETVSQGAGTIDWLDFKFAPQKKWGDAELKGLEFLSDNQKLQAEWRNFWVVGSGIHNWDAVGWLHYPKGEELLLVEAKENTEEIKSDCKAEGDSLEKIQKSLEVVRKDLGATVGHDWTKKYYQFANRLATIHFLEKYNITARLVLVYFVGDLIGAGRKCPQSVEGWDSALNEQDRWIGLPEHHLLSDRIHKVFLNVNNELPAQ